MAGREGAGRSTGEDGAASRLARSLTLSAMERRQKSLQGSTRVEEREAALAAELQPLEGPDGSIPYEAFCKALGVGPQTSFARGLYASCRDPEPGDTADASCQGGARVTATRAARAALLLQHSDLEGSLRLAVGACLAGRGRAADSKLGAEDVAAVLQSVLGDLRVEAPPAVMDQLAADIVQQADVHGTGSISFEEFFDFAMRFPSFRQLADARARQQATDAQHGAGTGLGRRMQHTAGGVLRRYSFWILFACCLAPLLYWFLNVPLIYSLGAADVWLAKFCGATAGLAATFLMVPLTSLVLEALRRSRLMTRLFDFDANISIHKVLGYLILFGGVAHAICWWIAFGRTVGTTSWDEVNLIAPGVGHLEPTAAELFGSTAAITGYIMLAALLLALPFAMPYPKAWLKGTALAGWLNKYTPFLVSHRIMFVAFYVCLILHPLPGLWTKPYTGAMWMFVSIPLLLFGLSRAWYGLRAFGALAPVVKAEVLANAGGNIVVLHLRRPRVLRYEPLRDRLRRGELLPRAPLVQDRFTFRPGQYVRISCPNISPGPSDWHPFTISSSPGDELLTLHIAAVGDWTRSLLQLVRDGRDDRGRVTGPCIPWWGRRPGQLDVEAEPAPAAGDVEKGSKGAHATPTTSEEEAAAAATGAAGGIAGLSPGMPTIYVSGPFGAPAMAFERYRVLVLASAGVGVTPMVSILKHLATLPASKRPCTYFRWVVREQGAAQRWVPSALHAAVDAAGGDGGLDICVNYTGGGRGPRPTQAQQALLALAAEVHQAGAGTDLITGVASAHGVVRSEYGRPDWSAVLERAARENPAAEEIGVLFCGAKPVEKDLRRCCEQHSRPGGQRFQLHAENF